MQIRGPPRLLIRLSGGGAQHFVFHQALQRVREALSEIPAPGKESSWCQHLWQMLPETFTGHIPITA